MASLVAQMVKNLLAMRETWVQSLDKEDPLEKRMATHSSILSWRIPRTEEPGGYSPWGHKEGDMTALIAGLSRHRPTGRRMLFTWLSPCFSIG